MQALDAAWLHYAKCHERVTVKVKPNRGVWVDKDFEPGALTLVPLGCPILKDKSTVPPPVALRYPKTLRTR